MMKKIFAFVLLIYPFVLHSQDKVNVPQPNPFASFKPLPYSQLIGFKVGGAYYVNTSLSEATSSIFFESVMNNFIGLEIELGAYSIPVTNYNVSGVAVSGNGLRKYVELSGGFKFYLFGAGLYLGLSYNDFISGYLITESSGIKYYNTMSDQERDFFSIQIGPEINAQISSDLFSKVGVRFVYGFVPDDLNYTVAIRFFISFAYGL